MEDLTKLMADKGYTKDQILAFLTPSEDKPPEDKKDKKEFFTEEELAGMIEAKVQEAMKSAPKNQPTFKADDKQEEGKKGYKVLKMK